MGSLMPPKTKIALDTYIYGPNGPIPYMSQEETILHKRYIRGKNVLELGAGGSTLYFAPITNSYTSLEGHPLWYCAILGIILHRGDIYQNIKIFYSPYDIKHTSEYMTGHKDYLNGVKMIMNEIYDIIIIDSQSSCRLECAQIIEPYMRKDAIIFWHEYYHYKTPEWEKYVTEHFDIIDTAPGIDKYDPEGKGNLAVMRKK